MGTVFDAVLGRFFNSGVEVELGAGVDCLRGIQAAKNASNQRVDVSADCPYVYRSGYKFKGDDTSIATGAGDIALALDDDATTIAIGSIVSAGSAVEVTLRSWISRSSGIQIFRDEVRFGVYRESSTSELHLLDLEQNGADDVGTGTRSLTITGVHSAIDYTITAAYSGLLAIAFEQNAVSAYVVRPTLWISESWAAS